MVKRGCFLLALERSASARGFSKENILGTNEKGKGVEKVTEGGSEINVIRQMIRQAFPSVLRSPCAGSSEEPSPIAMMDLSSVIGAREDLRCIS